ncbi:MAG: bifunctional phosphopantothenoylcysteine decarboxylase/phosphopantothenate--cysteine ligase CoaBC, partial [Chloroflexota bacterium]
MSENHRIVLALSGSIAAYKGAALASDLVKSGHEVRCIMTSGARQFLAPLTLEALTGHKVTDDLWLEQPDGGIGHIELAKWASVLLVAPASASTLAHLAHGLADDALGAVALATEAPLVVAPAMESAMFAHLATQANLRLLLERGAHVVGPDSGRLASGAKGVGRMAEPSAILQTLARLLETRVDLRGSTVLVTAGPTYESIDWVRFLGNRSSGKMGYAVAEAALARGARVILITGPTALTPPRGVETIAVESADQMRGAVLDHVDAANVVIMAAAVADYRPAEVVDGKLRRSGELTLQLVPTPDIAADAAADAPHAVHV